MRKARRWAVLFLAATACATGSSELSRRAASTGAGGDGAGSGSGVIGGLGGSSGMLGGVASPPKDPTLPPPWQYFAKDSDLGFKDPGLGSDVKDKFGGASDAAGAPSLVYPLDHSMHPMNLQQITFQWTRGKSSSVLFRIDGAAGGSTYHFFVPCTPASATAPDQCTYAMPPSEWVDLGERYKGAGPVSFTVSGTDGAGGPVGTSAPIQIWYSPEPVLGSLYYWSQTASGIKRATFGSKKAVLYIQPESPSNQFKCAGCHSVSRNGQVIAFAVQQTRDHDGMGIQTAPADDATKPFVKPTLGTSPGGVGYPRTPGQLEAQDHFGNNVALSPDGAIAAVNGASFGSPPGEEYFELRDTKTGNTLMAPMTASAPAKPAQWIIGDPLFGASQLPILPEWSPDGKSLAVTLMNRASGCGWTFFSCQSKIAILPFADNTIGAPVVIAENGAGAAMFHFYPSWSPDGQYVAFASAPDPGSNAKDGSSSDNRNAVIRMVPSQGGPHACPGPTCYELTRGTQYTVADALAKRGKGSTWPKFTPFDQGSGKVMFVSFTSRIDYGFLVKGQAQLWMFAVDTTKLGTDDPSFAPIWIPYQDFTDQSFAPYWTEVSPCKSDPNGGCSGCVGEESCVIEAQNSCHCSVIVK